MFRDFGKAVVKINILAVGGKPPSWVEAGISQYIARMSGKYRVEIITILDDKRTIKSSGYTSTEREQQLLVRGILGNSLYIAMDEGGEPWAMVGFAAHVGACVAC